MAIAFGGLFLAGEPAMNQLAFFFVTSVLVDTFLTRTILVPCMMDVLVSCHWVAFFSRCQRGRCRQGRLNWLPRPMPTPAKTISPVRNSSKLNPLHCLAPAVALWFTAA